MNDNKNNDNKNVNNNNNNNARPKRHAAKRANAFLYHEHASVLCWSEEKDLKKALLASLQETKRSTTKSSASTSKSRPKRHAAKRANAFLYHEHASVLCWSEEKDLKKALLASLQEAKRSSSKSSASTSLGTKSNAFLDDNMDKSSCSSKSNNTQSKCSLNDDNKHINSSLLSLAARRARIPAQRKFAQGSANNSPDCTPVKIGIVSANNAVEIFPNQKPKTEDFLTFLCLRRTPVLPPSIDFFAINNNNNNDNNKNNNDMKTNSDSQKKAESNDSVSDVENNQTSLPCPQRNFNRRGSGSSTLSKTTSNCGKVTSQTNKTVDTKKSLESKNQMMPRQRKKNQSNVCSPVKKQKEDAKPSSMTPPSSGAQLKHTHSKAIPKPNSLATNGKAAALHNLKEKYKQRRIATTLAVPSNRSSCKNDDKLKNNKKLRNSDNKKCVERILTRQSTRSSFHLSQRQPNKSKVNVSTSNSQLSQRVLRSHHTSICTHSQPSLPTTLLLHPANRKSKVSTLNQVGIRPQTRKAKPVGPLVDYHLEIEPEASKNKMKSLKSKKSLSGSDVVKATQKCDNKTSPRPPGRPKGSTKSKVTKKVGATSQTKRLTRSCSRQTPPKDAAALERERLIKQQIIEIEKKHKRMRRFPSDQSLHSSSSSSTSSESLPTSSSSSSSINIPRLTRSLEHLKRIRDIAAKLKKQQKNRKESKKNCKNKTESKNNNNNNNKKSTQKKQTTNKFNKKCVKVNKVLLTNKSAKTRNSKKQPVRDFGKQIRNKFTQPVVENNTDSDCDDGDESEVMVTESSIESNLDENMERASIVLQDMADEINTLDDVTNEVANSVPDLVYGSAGHIQGLMTSEFSGAFSEETVTTASAMLLPSSSTSYHYIQPVDVPTLTRTTADASTNTNDDDILSSLEEEEMES